MGGAVCMGLWLAVGSACVAQTRGPLHLSSTPALSPAALIRPISSASQTTPAEETPGLPGELHSRQAVPAASGSITPILHPTSTPSSYRNPLAFEITPSKTSNSSAATSTPKSSSGFIYYFATSTAAGSYLPTATWSVRYFTPYPTSTPRPTFTPTRTFTPRPTCTLISSKTPTPTATQAFTRTPTPTPSPTHTSSPTASPSPTLQSSLETPELTFTPTATVTFTPTSAPDLDSIVFSADADLDGTPEVYVLRGLDSLPVKEPLFVSGLLCAASEGDPGLLVQTFAAEPPRTDLISVTLDGMITRLTDSLPGSSTCGDWKTDGSGLIFPALDADGQMDLYFSTLDGSGLTALTQDALVESEPALSPDGSWAAFIVDGDIWAVQLDGSQLHALTNTTEIESSPRWSPDGAALLFSRQVDGQNDLFLLHLQDSVETRLTDTAWNETTPDFSRSGSEIVFVSNAEGQADLYRMDLAGAHLQRLTMDSAVEMHPRWLLVEP